MMFAEVELEDRMAFVEMVAGDQAGGFELGEHAVDGGQPHLVAGFQQGLVHLLGAHVALLGFLEELENLQAWQGGLESGPFQILAFHGRLRGPLLNPTGMG